jgi:hypothetical protein
VSEAAYNILKSQGKTNTQPSDADIDAVMDQAWATVCTNNGGVVKGKACSYKDKASCDAGYSWPLKDTDNYGEWNSQTNQCEGTSPGMRATCISNKFNYTPGIGNSCDLDNKYCAAKGMQFKNGDCYINQGQNIAEQIFGKTLTRGLIQLFDPAQYSKCDEGWKDDGYFCRKLDCPAGTTINKLGTFCYPNCPPGWHMTDGGATGTCSQDCPSPLNDTGIATCGKPTERGRGAGTEPDCKDGYYKSSPGFCQPKCNDPNFPKQQGSICYHKDVNTALLVKTPGKRGCDGGQRDDGTSCWEDLKTSCGWGGWHNTVLHCNTTGCGCIKKNLFDRQYCDSGYDLKAGMCYAQSRTVGAVESTGGGAGVCPPGQEKQGLLCYPNCPDGWSKSGLNLCQYNCPSGLSDGGVASCNKQPIKMLTPTAPKVTIKAKHRVVPFASDEKR